jgi:aryl-alcohol dehydrogenase-like predicted oxidoreductase
LFQKGGAMNETPDTRMAELFNAMVGAYETWAEPLSARLALAWVLANQPRLVPLVGTRTRAQLLDLLAALERPLPGEEVQALEAIVPTDAILGSRYPAEHMAWLDSEV